MKKSIMKCYRLRLVRFDRPQTKIVMISSENEQAARRRARARFGLEWRVTHAQVSHFG